MTRANLKWHHPEFTVPPEVMAHMHQALERGERQERQWREKLADYRRAFPKEAAQLEQDLSGDLPQGWDEGLADFFKGQTTAYGDT